MRAKANRLYERYRDATMIPKYAFADNIELARMIAADRRLAHFSVAECGTWRGGMSAGLIETFGPERAYYFFDSFAGLPTAQEIDGEAALKWQRNANSADYFDNCSASQEAFTATIQRTGIDLDHVHIRKGLFQDTVGTLDVGTIALLRLDCDWYESVTCCLQALFPKVANGGYVIIDDYGYWDGCTRAVHDYLSQNKRTEPIFRYGLSGVPYIQVRDA